MKISTLINIFDHIDTAIMLCSRLVKEDGDPDDLGMAAEIADQLTEVAANIEIYLDENERSIPSTLQARYNQLKTRTSL
jgi:hypothetical protein